MRTPYYYTYNFVTPENIWAEVKEEMKSYFNTGVIDDTMFPIYTDKALRKLGRTTLKIDTTVLELQNSQAELPCDFKYVRDVWVCKDVCHTVPHANSYYSQKTCIVSPYGDYDKCNPCSTCPPTCDQEYKVFYKTTREELLRFKLSYRLVPGNLNARQNCSDDCFVTDPDLDNLGTFDIRDGKIITTVHSGTLYLIYYKLEKDENDYQLIPDNFRIQEFIKSYIKWRMYEQLWNEVVDETSNQIERKYQVYKAEADEAYVLADIETKKQTVQQKVNGMKRTKHRLDKYKRGLENRDYYGRQF